jgi:hypothetical protein
MTIVSLLFGAGSYYFFSQGRYILGSLFLLWACVGLFGEPLGNYFAGLALVNRDFHVERDCNVSLDVGINVEAAVRHPSVVRVFGRLREKNAIRDASHAEWAERLLDNYKRKHEAASPWETARFHIKSNLVWKNGELDSSDAIWHEVFLPYAGAAGEAKYAPGFPPGLESGLTIRLILVNGILKLMVGDYSKENSPNQFTGLAGVQGYQARETITSFPLLYFPAQHRLPERYMNFTAAGTRSYHMIYSANPKERKQGTAEWTKLYRDVRKYIYACRIRKERVPHVLEGPRWLKIIKEFDAKKEEWLQREGFRRLSADRETVEADPEVHYENNCLRVVVTDHSDANAKLRKHIFPDYIIEGKH